MGRKVQLRSTTNDSAFKVVSTVQITLISGSTHQVPQRKEDRLSVSLSIIIIVPNDEGEE